MIRPKLAIHRTVRFVKNHLGDILTIGATIGAVATPILAAKAMHDTDETTSDALTTREKIEANWTRFVPAGISLAATVGCIWGARSKYSAVATAATGTAQFFRHKYKDLRKKMVEMYGEEKTKEIEREIAKDNIKASPAPAVVKGDDIFEWYEPQTDQLFWAKESDITELALYCNRLLTSRYELHLNELLAFLPDKNIKLVAGGDTIGWFTDNDFWCNTWSYLGEQGSPWLDIDWDEIELDGRKVRCLIYNVTPDVYEYPSEDQDYAPIKRNQN